MTTHLSSYAYHKHSDVIWSFNFIHEVTGYVAINSHRLSPYEWVATANKIEHLMRTKGEQLKQADVRRLERYFDLTKLPNFRNNQVVRLIEFYGRWASNSPMIRIFMSTMVDRIGNRDVLRDFIADFGFQFDVITWQRAINAMANLEEPQIEEIVRTNLNRSLIADGAYIIQEQLANLGITAKLHLSPEELTSRLNYWKITDQNSLQNFLKFIEANSFEFNHIHWAVVGTKLYRSHVKFIHPSLLQPLLQQLKSFSGAFGAGELAQVIGGLVRFINTDPGLTRKLADVLRDSAERMSPEELIMIMHAIRKLPYGNPAVFELLNILGTYLFTPQGLNKMENKFDLFAVFVHSCGERGCHSTLEKVEDFIFANCDRFELREILEVLEGLAELAETNKGSPSPLVIEKLIQCLMHELKKTTDTRKTSFAISKAASNFANLRYVSLEWTNYALEEAEKPGFRVWEKIYLATALARLGQFNQGATPALRNFMDKTVNEYFAFITNELLAQYPDDAVSLAYSCALLYKRERLELSHRLIEMARGTKSLSDESQSMLYQACLLTGYEEAKPPIFTQNTTESHLQQTVLNELKSRMVQDSRFNGAELLIEANLLGYSHVDGKIVKLKTRDGKPIVIEVDGPHHRAANILPQETLPRNLGRTEAKHQIIKDSPAHLVVIDASGINDPNLQNGINKAWDDIVSHLE